MELKNKKVLVTGEGLLQSSHHDWLNLRTGNSWHNITLNHWGWIDTFDKNIRDNTSL